MGTRHLVCVQLNGQYKVAQYGQMDGYPDYCGVNLKNSIIKHPTEKMRSAVSKALLLPFDDKEKFRYFYDSEDEFLEKNPFVSRFLADEVIDRLIEYPENSNPVLFSAIHFAGESLFCEWAYVIDLDKEQFEVYRGFQKEPHPENERFTHLNDETDEFYPVRLLQSFSFVELANLTDDEFVEQVQSVVI